MQLSATRFAVFACKHIVCSLACLHIVCHSVPCVHVLFHSVASDESSLCAACSMTASAPSPRVGLSSTWRQSLSNSKATRLRCSCLLTSPFHRPIHSSISCIRAQVDWWSIGVLLYECLHGYTPFSEEGSIEDDWHVIRNIVNASYPLRYGHLLSDEAIQLMKEMLTHDPAERIDAQGMQKHPFFSCVTPIRCR